MLSPTLWHGLMIYIAGTAGKMVKGTMIDQTIDLLCGLQVIATVSMDNIQMKLVSELEANVPFLETKARIAK